MIGQFGLARAKVVRIYNPVDIDSITALDLFPQTHHVEVVVRMT